MKPNDEIMSKLHKIRAGHYEEIKDLSPEEQLAFDNKKVDGIKRKYHLNLPKMQAISPTVPNR